MLLAPRPAAVLYWRRKEVILLYAYIFDGTDMNIRTPNLTDFSLVKKELISQTASKIVTRLTYPDGLEFTVEQESKRVTVYSNRPLIQNPDGSYTAP